MKKTVLTGDRPTGKLHLGHYVGSIQNRIKLQDQADQAFYMVADVQALTDNAENPQKVRDNVLEVVLDNLACGVDPKKTTFFIQSGVPEIAELTVFFLNLVTVSHLEQNPTVKTEIKQKFSKSIPAGFLCYPVSQAADILFCKANIIPVGEDQKPMIEQCNDIGSAFNRIYGELFPHVTQVIGDTPRLVGTDGNAKMSKSLNNGIYLSDSKEVIAEKVMSMYTDPNHIRLEDPGSVEGNVVFAYLDVFDTDVAGVAALKEHYQRGGLGDVTLKKHLIEVLESVIGPIRARREAIQSELGTDGLIALLKAGTEQAKLVGQQTMREVRSAMKIDYF